MLAKGSPPDLLIVSKNVNVNSPKEYQKSILITQSLVYQTYWNKGTFKVLAVSQKGDSKKQYLQGLGGWVYEVSNKSFMAGN